MNLAISAKGAGDIEMRPSDNAANIWGCPSSLGRELQRWRSALRGVVASSLGGSYGISSGRVMKAAEFFGHSKVLTLGESRRRRTMETIGHQRLAVPKCRTCSLS